MNFKEPYLVIQSTQAPYSTSACIDAMEAALAASNLGISVVFLLVDDGVFQLVAEQNSQAISHKSIYKKLSVFPLFDIELLFAQHSAIVSNGISIDNLRFDVKTLEDPQIVELCQQATHVLVF